jgi:hypothetical protein
MLVKFILAFGSEFFDSLSILDSEFQHIVGGIPPCCHVMWHDSHIQPQFYKTFLSRWQENCRRMDNFEGQFSKLWDRSVSGE